MAAHHLSDGMTNWFDQGGGNYARYRPDYPDELARFLAGMAPDRRRAVDVGCGNGQFTTQLAAHFDSVTGLDPSADQIANAVPHEKVRYLCAPAEQSGLPDNSAGLITAAQAAHWFDLPRFYAEARRIAMPGAVLALVSYGVPEFEAELNQRFLIFYRDEIGPYWPAERKLVDSGYAGMDFPFAERACPRLVIERQWSAADFLGYVSTWSATRRAREAGREDLLMRFADDLRALWGARARHVIWPINMRLGII
jgi:SAM-dependent methyltransferase